MSLMKNLLSNFSLILYHYFTRLVFNLDMLINGDAETGACATDSSITRPVGWSYDGDITQLAYNNSIIYSRTSTIPATA